MERKKIIVAVTGASGAELGLSILHALQVQNAEIHLILSEGAKNVIRQETPYKEKDYTDLADFCYDESEIGADIASGSCYTDGMIVAPCSMKTLAGIANAYDENLCIRAADVCLKERRRLVLLPREMPLNNAHQHQPHTDLSPAGRWPSRIPHHHPKNRSRHPGNSHDG